MAYRKRYRRKYSSVNKQTFQWFADISTLADTMQIITVSAGGEMVKRRLKPFFEAYKYYKLGTVSVKLVPASTLPVDPTGLSYESGEPGVDPRDQLSPGLTRITNGEDVFEKLTGVSADVQHKIYNQMMLDRRWYKWQLQSGLKRWAKPRFWQIGQLHQDYFPGQMLNLPVDHHTQSGDLPVIGMAVHRFGISDDGSGDHPVVSDKLADRYSDKRGLFQIGHKGTLGWLPTDALIGAMGGHYSDTPLSAAVPEVEVYKIILPPAYKTRYYYRAFITETVYFKDAVNNILTESEDGLVYSSMDRFIRPSAVWNESLPTDYSTWGVSNPNPNNDGGGAR